MKQPAAIVLSLTITLPVAAFAFDRTTTDAMITCHDYLLTSEDSFADLPQAAFTVFPIMMDEKRTTIAWHVEWDGPEVRAAGNCTVIDGTLEGFENFTSQ